MRSAATIALAVPLVACGGPISKGEFVKRADAVCAAANKAARRLGPEPTTLTSRHAVWILALTRNDRAAVAALRRLPRPAHATLIARMLREFDRGLAFGPAIARASRRGDERTFRAAVKRALDLITAGQLDAAAYGLDPCTKIGAVADR